jgi:phenylacetic acid degradation operon negative regulatory protein
MNKETPTSVQSFLKTRVLRAGSLAITVFGDCISQHGGSVWIGSLIQVMEKFGLNARQVRTAVFRLSQNGWLQSERIGRRSYYTLSEAGNLDYDRASRQIYSSGEPSWDKLWTILICSKEGFFGYEEFVRHLKWLGFGVLVNGALAHPRTDVAALKKLIQEFKAARYVTHWQASLKDDLIPKKLVKSAWELDDVSLRYNSFIQDFSSLSNSIPKSKELTAEDSFIFRILLIHEYRRILLKVADLPHEILPRAWPGHLAMTITGDLYRQLSEHSIDYIQEKFARYEGAFLGANEGFYQRFGGL